MVIILLFFTVFLDQINATLFYLLFPFFYKTLKNPTDSKMLTGSICKKCYQFITCCIFLLIWYGVYYENLVLFSRKATILYFLL